MFCILCSELSFQLGMCLLRLSVRLSVSLKPKFGRLKTKFDDDADNACEGSAKRKRTWAGRYLPAYLTSITNLFFDENMLEHK